MTQSHKPGRFFGLADRPALFPYGVALGGTLAALAVRIALDPLLRDNGPYLPFVLAVLVASRFGGRLAGFSAAVVSTLAVDWFFLEPRHAFAVQGSGGQAGLAVFFVVAILISLLVGRFRATLLASSRTGQALRESEQRYRTLFDSMHEGFVVGEVICDAAGEPVDFRYLEANAALARMFRRGRESIIGQTYRGLFPDAAGEYWVRGFGQVALTGKPAHLNNYGAGTGIYYETTAYSPRHGQFAAVLNDVSDRMRAEGALRESETRFRSTMDSMIEGCQLLGPDWRYLYINDAAERHNRRSRRELLGNRYVDMWPGIEATGVFAVLRRCLEQQIPAAMENEFTFPDGYKGWFDLRIEAVPEGVFILSVDITERKHAEEALRRSEALYRGIARNLPDGMVCVVDLEMRCIGLEGMLAAAWGLDRDSAEGRPVLDLVDQELRPGVEARFRGALAGSTASYETEVRGSAIWSQYTPLREENGAVVGAMMLALDITVRKRAEEGIRRLNAELESRVRERTAQLEAANRELEAFSYSVSHDLRAPLRGIDGWSLALVEDYAGRLDGQAIQYLDRVRFETQRMGALIDDLLELSRVSRRQMERKPVDLGALALTVADRLREANPERQIEFVIGGGLTAEGDARLFDVMLTNLFDNAVKFTGKRSPARIEFNQAAGADERTFYVRDNGVGFDPAYAGKLFGAFQRLHTASEFPGTGIGLATVQRIVHRHGGRIWAEGGVDEGAAFFFTLGV
jgi:PAS domain S-box-containing protein